MVPMDKYTRLVDGSYVTCTVVIGQASPGYSKDHEIKGVVFFRWSFTQSKDYIQEMVNSLR